MKWLDTGRTISHNTPTLNKQESMNDKSGIPHSESA